jgi:meiotically up-regulated gene 157 (Mug157) protein
MTKLLEMESTKSTNSGHSRRDFMRTGSLAALYSGIPGRALSGLAEAQQSPVAVPPVTAPWDVKQGRPKLSERRFRSPAVEEFLIERKARIGDPVLSALFVNCFPNTLDTTVVPGQFEGKPDTAVLTGDIAAMWLRDSSAQVWPYLPLAAKDTALRQLLEGVIRRQTRCILIDPYANAFMADLNAPPLPWSVKDLTDMKRGVGERKWEVDSLCYPIRLAHGYWKHTGDTGPFDQQWRQAMRVAVDTLRVQQRRHGVGTYHFQRESTVSTETLQGGGFGNPVRPVGLIASGFRPSDDACVFPFLVPSNLFAVTSLRQLADISHAILHDDALANEARALAGEIELALRQYAVATTPTGSIWAYEVDGFGSQLLMDDANVPSLLGLPYLESSPDAGLYARTRAFLWSERNPWFFRGSAGEGIGGPHEGVGMIWPMSQIIYALTSSDPGEIRRALGMLKGSAEGFGFMHESYYRDDSRRFTRAWFAWANTLFGELVGTLAASRPELLRA